MGLHSFSAQYVPQLLNERLIVDVVMLGYAVHIKQQQV